jgi:single-strand DNA-binding protein
MAGVNKVILLGRLGKDPELKTFEGGGKICNVTLATSENYTDREGNKVERTEWHNIVFNDKLADLANTYLTKGREVYIEGKIRTRNYDDANGAKRYVTEIVAINLNFIGSKPEERNTTNFAPNIAQETPTKSNIETQFESADNDDLPF